jgi:hypothetical protein
MELLWIQLSKSTAMKPTAKSPINELRALIYRACGVAHLRSSTRSRRLRKVCEASRGLDLRRKADVVLLAQRLGILPVDNVIYLDFSQKTLAAG